MPIPDANKFIQMTLETPITAVTVYTEVWNNRNSIKSGEAGIRTLGPREGSTVFETAPFNRSGTSPLLDRRPAHR
jgi:hypothetical protein